MRRRMPHPNRRILLYAAVFLLLWALLLIAVSVLVHIPIASLSGRANGMSVGNILQVPHQALIIRYILVGAATGTWERIEMPDLSTFTVSDGRVSSETPGRNIMIPDFIGMGRGILNWLFSLVLRDAQAACGSGGGTCYWIGGTGTSSTTTWSASSGGLACFCTPATTDAVIWDFGSGTGTASLAGATTWGAATISTSTMTVSTTASNYSLTLSSLTMSVGALTTGTSVVTINGNVNLSGTGEYITSASGGSWTISGSWSNASTSASWSFVASVAFTSSSNQTMTFDGASQVHEFANTLNPVNFVPASGTPTFTMAGALTATGTIYIGSANPVTLSTGNFSISADGIHIAANSVLNAGSSNVTVSGAFGGIVNVPSSAYITSTVGGAWTVGPYGGWLNLSASSSWSFAASVTFIGLSLMPNDTFCQCGGGTEFSGDVTFKLNSPSGLVQFTIDPASKPLTWGGTLTIQGASPFGAALVTNGIAITGKNLTLASFGQLSPSSSRITLTGDLKSLGGSLLGLSSASTLSFTGNGALFSLTTVHTIDVKGEDLWNVIASGSTTLYFMSSFTTETLTVNSTVLFAFETSGATVTWTYNGGGVLYSSNPPIYLESVSTGQLCQGNWAFANSQSLIAVQVIVCGSQATYLIQDPNGVDLGGNLRWQFGGGKGGYGTIRISCVPQYNLLSYLVVCTTNITDPDLASRLMWSLDGTQGNVGPTGYMRILVPSLGPMQTVAKARFAWTGILANQTVTLDGSPNLIVYAGGGIVLILIVLGIKGSNVPVRRQRFIHNENHRQMAIKVSPWPDRSENPRWLSYRQRNPSEFRRIRTLNRYHSKKYDRDLWVLGGPLKSTGRVEVQTTREKAKRNERIVGDHFVKAS